MQFIGIDVGTSATKVIVIDDRGEILASAATGYELLQPRAGWTEQNPVDWWNATVLAVREVLGSSHVSRDRIAGIGLSGQMHGLVMLKQISDPSKLDAVLRPALLWNDQRTSVECAEITAKLGGVGRVVEAAGNAALTGFTLPKMLWVKKNEPRIWAQVKCVLTPKDYIRWMMTGNAAIDVGDASGTLLVDPAVRGYNAKMLGAMGIDAGLMPPILESAESGGNLSAWAAGQLGLAVDKIPVAAGSGDNMAGAIGAGVVKPGLALSTIGTSGVIYTHAEVCRKDLAVLGTPGRVHTMCAADGTGSKAGHWCVTGCTLSAGGSLKWAKDTLFPDVSYEQLFAEAEKVEAGSGGLCFLPYLTGERCPHPDPFARGGFVGLSLSHTRGHLVRAILEGVTFTMGQILDIQASMGIAIETVRLGGGGAKSELWKQMQADVFGRTVAVTNTEEGPALGAALLGGVVAGRWGSVAEACEATIREVERIEPADTGKYAKARATFEHLYDDLRAAMHELSA